MFNTLIDLNCYLGVHSGPCIVYSFALNELDPGLIYLSADMALLHRVTAHPSCGTLVLKKNSHYRCDY